MSNPNITIEVYLDTYGYEIHFKKDKKDVLVLCRDFSDDKPVNAREKQILEAMIKAIEELK